MYRKLLRRIRKRQYHDINPEDIFIDSTNLPGFENTRLQGRIEKPMGYKTFLVFKIVLALVVVALVSKLWVLGVNLGPAYADISENNRLEKTMIFANRGIIYDRGKLELATNAVKDGEGDFAGRLYAPIKGLAHTVGYLRYPLADKLGVYYEKNYLGRDGAEQVFDKELGGTNGVKLKETDVFGHVTSESVIDKPIDGKAVVLSIDAHLTEVLYNSIETLSKSSNYVGGAAVVMDARTGEVLALTSFPEYDSNMLTSGTDQASLNRLIESPSKPFLNRVTGGLYTPGSILKPIIALAALNEKIISPDKKILSTGSISVPNPYDLDKPSVFKDWKAHGWTDMRQALAVSSDTYFYSIGGGYGDQEGLGITTLDKYFRLFGLGEKTGIDLGGEVDGVIATPEWKKEKFDGEIWRLGDTYITSIGQYGMQVTPLNAARFIAAIASGGKLLKPSILLGGDPNPVERMIELNEEDWRVAREGMREGVISGTSVGINVPYVSAAAKTGTAEVGAGKLYVHSWSVGFFPFDNPKYAWAVVMEKGPRTGAAGATTVVRQLFDWMSVNTPEYFE